jgi:hypothetical protein
MRWLERYLTEGSPRLQHLRGDHGEPGEARAVEGNAPGRRSQDRRHAPGARFWFAPASSSMGEGNLPMQRRHSAAWRQRKPPLHREHQRASFGQPARLSRHEATFGGLAAAGRRLCRAQSMPRLLRLGAGAATSPSAPGSLVPPGLTRRLEGSDRFSGTLQRACARRGGQAAVKISPWKPSISSTRRTLRGESTFRAPLGRRRL